MRSVVEDGANNKHLYKSVSLLQGQTEEVGRSGGFFQMKEYSMFRTPFSKTKGKISIG